MMLQGQRVGGYEFHTATVGETDGRALSRIFCLLWAICTFCLLLFIVWGLELGLSWPSPHFEADNQTKAVLQAFPNSKTKLLLKINS